MREIKRVSRWIAIQTNCKVNKNNSLYDYASDENGCSVQSENFNPENGVFLDFFRFNGRTYALNQFLNRFGICGFDFDCEEYPSFITGYDGTDYYKPLLCELDDCGSRIRLYQEV